MGTAGFTALLCSFTIKAREELLMGEKVKDVLVTGATGGVGSIAVMILSKMGYDVHAVTGKKDGLLFAFCYGIIAVTYACYKFYLKGWRDED